MVIIPRKPKKRFNKKSYDYHGFSTDSKSLRVRKRALKKLGYSVRTADSEVKTKGIKGKKLKPIKEIYIRKK